MGDGPGGAGGSGGAALEARGDRSIGKRGFRGFAFAGELQSGIFYGNGRIRPASAEYFYFQKYEAGRLAAEAVLEKGHTKAGCILLETEQDILKGVEAAFRGGSCRRKSGVLSRKGQGRYPGKRNCLLHGKRCVGNDMWQSGNSRHGIGVCGENRNPGSAGVVPYLPGGTGCAGIYGRRDRFRKVSPAADDDFRRTSFITDDYGKRNAKSRGNSIPGCRKEAASEGTKRGRGAEKSWWSAA